VIVASVILEFILYVVCVVLGVHFTSVPTRGNTFGIIKYNYIVMAIILSSFGKGFTFLMMIWDYTHSFSIFSTIIDIFVLTSNTLVLKVFLATTTVKAGSIIAISFLCKTLFDFIWNVTYYTHTVYCILNFCIK